MRPHQVYVKEIFRFIGSFLEAILLKKGKTMALMQQPMKFTSKVALFKRVGRCELSIGFPRGALKSFCLLFHQSHKFLLCKYS